MLPTRESLAMRAFLIPAIAAVLTAAVPTGLHADVKNVPYPEVKVKLGTRYQPDAAFEKMRTALVDATAKKDTTALLRLVGPTFVWTLNDELADKFDFGRDAVHNFKVVFGFRDYGKDVDGGVEDGPFWDALASFAADKIYYQATDDGNLICGPMAAEIVDDEKFEQAGKKIEAEDDGGADWYFTIGDVAVTKSPGDTGPPVARLGTVALPVLGTSAQSQDAQPTHLQVLLPSGKTGWIPASAARPFNSNRLCYAKTANGDWKVVLFSESE